MQNALDLTKYRLTFPDLPEPQILRGNLVKWLHDRFSPDRKVIIVQGPDGAGKTTLLAQFAKTYPDRCFCFFVKKDYWTSKPDFFLRELCTQMQKVVRERDDDIDGNYYELKQLFGKFYHQVAKKACRRKQSFYFVIDGLEWIPESYGQESIMDLLPYDPPDGIYLLASSAPGQEFRFAHYSCPIEFFSSTETEAYLRNIGLDDKEKTTRIHNVCEGMPGYLDQIRREIQSGISVDEILTNLPTGFQELLEREWERVGIRDDCACALNALAILAHSKISLDLATLAEIVGLVLFHITDLDFWGKVTILCPLWLSKYVPSHPKSQRPWSAGSGLMTLCATGEPAC